MGVEAPSIGAPTIAAPAVEIPTFSGPEFSPGGLGSPGGEVGSLSDFQSAFDFGPEHQISGEAFSSGRAVFPSENIFNENLFEVVARPHVQPEIPQLTEIFGPGNQLSGEIFSSDRVVPNPENVFNENFFEILVKPKESPASLGADESLKEKSPLDSEIFEPKPEGSAAEITFVAKTEPLTGEDKEEENEVAKRKPQKVVQPGVLPNQTEKTVWQILAGDINPRQTLDVAPVEMTGEETERVIVRGKVELENEEDSQEKTETTAETAIFMESKKDDKGSIAVDSGERPEEEVPKEPLWKLSAKKEGKEGIDRRVLGRRDKVAKEIVEESAKEIAQEGERGRYWFVSKVTTRLGRLDTPSFKEAVRMVFGRLTFPLVTGVAKQELSRIKQEATPKEVLEFLHKILRKKPPLVSTADSMENKGSLPQSKLEKVSEEAAALAREGAEHIIYEPKTQKWIRVGKKPSQYPVELDKMKKTVSVDASKVVDREKSVWYTLFAQRAEARAKRRKAIS